MGMGKTLLKGIGYTKSPRTTFAFFNPKKAAFAKAAGWAMDRVRPGRRRGSTTMTAAKGLGAAAVAVPVGLWLGRKAKSRED